jgi:hypothetical protein
MSSSNSNELYEAKDVQARPLLIFLSGLTVMCLCVFFTVQSMQSMMTEQIQAKRGPDHPLASQRQPPSAPLLQANPTLEIRAHRAAESQALSELEWIDRQAGSVRLPIYLAMKLYLERNQ